MSNSQAQDRGRTLGNHDADEEPHPRAGPLPALRRQAADLRPEQEALPRHPRQPQDVSNALQDLGPGDGRDALHHAALQQLHGGQRREVKWTKSLCVHRFSDIWSTLDQGAKTDHIAGMMTI